MAVNKLRNITNNSQKPSLLRWLLFFSKSLQYMEDRITIIATSKLVANKLTELQEVVQELQIYCSETEKGMLQYDWYISETENTIKVL